MWKLNGKDLYSSDEITMFFWRGKDGAHLKEWLTRCESGLKELLPNQVHQVKISLWLPLDCPTTCVRGSIDAGNHVPYTKYTHEVTFDFGTEIPSEEASIDLFNPPGPKELELEVPRRPTSLLLRSSAGVAKRTQSTSGIPCEEKP
jgi:hypothetical protein